jgi:hypothetical protein
MQVSANDMARNALCILMSFSRHRPGPATGDFGRRRSRSPEHLFDRLFDELIVRLTTSTA